LSDSFSARRLFTFGLSSQLQSISTGTIGRGSLHLSDAVVAPAVLASLVFYYLRVNTQRTYTFLIFVSSILIGVAVGISAPRDNSSPYVWSVFALVVLALGMVHLAKSSHIMAATYVAGPLSFIICLRTSLGFVGILAFCFFSVYLSRLHRYKEVMIVPVLTILASFCWAFVAWRDTGAWFYPLTSGNQQFGILGFSNQSPGAGAGALQYMIDYKPAKVAFLILVFTVSFVFIFVKNTIWKISILSLAMSVTAGSILLITRMDLYSPWDQMRYLWPLAPSVLICAAISFAAYYRKYQLHILTSIGLIVLLLSLTITDARTFGISAAIRKLPSAVNKDSTWKFDDEQKILQLYKRTQNLIPPGCKVFAITDFPWAFDLRRNNVSTIDLPGFTSQFPGMPMLGDPNSFEDYLRKTGFEALIVSDPRQNIAESGSSAPVQGLYNAGRFDGWEGWANPLHTWAPTFISFLEMLQEFIDNNKDRTAQSGPMKVISFSKNCGPAMPRFFSSLS
jgi:hypothetical protein